MKKFIALLLAMMMLLSVLTACGNQNDPSETKAPAATNGQEEAPETQPSEAEELEHVELTWYIKSASNTADADTVMAAINEYLNNTLKLNVTLKLVFPSEYGDQTQMALAAGEDIDMCWTGNWGGLDFVTNVAKDAFYPLDELLAEYGQGILEVTPAYGMEACKVNGVTYAIPNQQGWFTQSALYMDKAIAEKYNFDPTSLTSYKDLEPLLAQVKADNPNSYPICVASSGNLFDRCIFELNYTLISGSKGVGGVLMDDQSCQVVNVYALPQMKELFDTMWDWNQKGYIRSDSTQMNGDDLVAAMNNGETVMVYDTYLPGDETKQAERFGHELVTVPVGTPFSSTGSIQSTMTAITANCKDPARAMMVLNAVNTDPVLYNLLCFGIEGVHYTVDANGCAVPVEGTTYDPNCDWSMGNQFNALLREGQAADTWEVTKAMNANTYAVPIMGFSFDATPVSNQMTAISSVVSEYLSTLIRGALDPDTIYDEFMTKLEAAGLQDVLDEMQAQIDAWKAAK